MPIRRIFASTVAVMLVLASAALAAAQSRGNISGTITDNSGAVLPGVAVVITNTDTGVERTLVTDAGGRFTAADLQPGPYSLKASLEGFATVNRSGVTL